MSHLKDDEVVGDASPNADAISGAQVLGCIQIAAVVAVIGHLMIAIPMNSLGIVSEGGAVRTWFLTCLASVLAIVIGILAKETDRLYGFPLKGGIWWNYRTSGHGISVVATMQIMLTLAILEIALFAGGAGW